MAEAIKLLLAFIAFKQTNWSKLVQTIKAACFPLRQAYHH